MERVGEDINPIGVMDSYCESQGVESVGQLFTMKSSARELLQAFEPARLPVIGN